jgi:hypothetical protein
MCHKNVIKRLMFFFLLLLLLVHISPQKEKKYEEVLWTTQIGILVPIEPQRRTNGTSGTGSSIKHLKAVPFKTKKAPKRGNFHSPM